jgi:hypothetical protein
MIWCVGLSDTQLIVHPVMELQHQACFHLAVALCQQLQLDSRSAALIACSHGVSSSKAARLSAQSAEHHISCIPFWHCWCTSVL